MTSQPVAVFGGMEFASFRLKPGVSETALRTAAAAVEQHLLQHQPGFISHALLRGDDDVYIDMVLADSREHAIAICEKWPDNAHGSHFLSLIAPGSAQLDFYQRLT